MANSRIDLSALHKALAQLEEALSFWRQQPDATLLAQALEKSLAS